MERPRITLARLMAIVGIIAVEIAAARALYFRDTELAAGLALMGLVSQFALFRVVRGRGRDRAFWSGFVVIGLAMTGTFAWAVCFQDSMMFSLWRSYTVFVDGILRMIPHAPRFYGGPSKSRAVWITATIVWFLPQLLAASMGGVSAILITRSTGSQDDRRLRAASP